MVADSSDNNPKSNGGAEKKKERTAGQFFHIGEQGGQGDASAKVGAELHPLDYWVLDTGAAWTMTPCKELLDDVRAAPINEVCSASGHALKVAGAGRAAFKGADGKPVVLHDVLLVPDLKANLISLRKLAKVGVSTSTDGARTYKGQLGNWLLWDLHESKDVYRSMWQLLALAWHGGGQVEEGCASQGECNAVGGVGVKVSARSGEMDWATAHRRLGHEAAGGHAEGWDGEKVQEAPAGGGDDVETSGSTKEVAGSEGGEQLGKAKVPALPSRRKLKGVVMRGWETPISRPGRTRMATMKLTAGADVAEQQLGNEEALLILPHGYHPDEEDEPTYCFLAPAPEEPASMEEALAGPDREKWLVSRDAEYQSLLENGTWDLVVLPEGKKAVQCKWVLRIKIDNKGQVTIYKSRLVAKWFMQKEKQYFNEIFAPTAKPPTLCFLLADAAVNGKSIIQIYISTTFLNGILEEDVYMTQPPGYEDGTGRVCKLKRTSNCDESLFLKGEGEKLVLFFVYVDDILLFSCSMKEIQKVQQQLMKNFKCKTLGEVKYYLGMHVERDLDHRWLKLYQEKFIKELAEKYGIENERKVATPLPAEFKLVKAAEDEGVEAEEQQQFQSLVGSLLYAAVHTRPDISFSVGQLARVVQNPLEEQVDAAERVVKYLNSHPSIGVQYSASAQVKQKGVEVLKEKGERLGEGKLFLTCFTDATWASEKDDSSSVGGYICVVGGGPVCWRSKKHTEMALSSVESEFRIIEADYKAWQHF
ncbi:unnamed protein product [Closterium sp. NIES-53]